MVTWLPCCQLKLPVNVNVHYIHSSEYIMVYSFLTRCSQVLHFSGPLCRISFIQSLDSNISFETSILIHFLQILLCISTMYIQYIHKLWDCTRHLSKINFVFRQLHNNSGKQWHILLMFLSKMWQRATIEELSSIFACVFDSVKTETFDFPFLLNGECSWNLGALNLL